MAVSQYLLTIFLLSIPIYAVKSADPITHLCDDQKTQIASGDIDTLLSALVKTTIQKGFIVTSYTGKSKSKLYGLAQCRGDVSTEDCSTCITDAAKEIRRLCRNRADAKIFYDFCFLRYSTVNFLGQVDTSGIYLYNVENVSDPVTFNRKLGALMDRVNSQAVMPRSHGLGRGESKLSPFVTLYGLSQCTRDLSQLACAQCLAIALGNFPSICDSKKGCRVVYASCYVRYELYPFYFPLDSKAASASSSSMSNYVSVVSKPQI